MRSQYCYMQPGLVVCSLVSLCSVDFARTVGLYRMPTVPHRVVHDTDPPLEKVYAMVDKYGTEVNIIEKVNAGPVMSRPVQAGGPGR